MNLFYRLEIKTKTMKNGRLLATILLFLAVFAAHAAPAQWTPETVVNQRLIDNSYVSDADRLLKPDEVARLNQILQEMEAETGVQCAIVILNSISERWDVIGFGVELFNLWGIGSRENNKGLMLLIVTETHDWRFFSGYGVEGDLPDATLNRLGNKYIVPAFRKEDYGRGLIEVCESIKQILTDAREASPAGNSGAVMAPWSNSFVITLWAGWLAVMGGAYYLMHKKPKKGRKHTSTDDRLFITELKGTEVMVLTPDKPAKPGIWQGKPAERFFSLYGLAGIVPAFATYSGHGFVYPQVNAVIGMYLYFFVLAIIIQYRLNKNARLISADGPAQFLNLREANKMMSFRMLFYPFAFIPYYIFYRNQLNQLKTGDTEFRQCHRTAHHLPREQYDQFLSPAELTEIRIKSRDTHLYRCDAGHLTQIRFAGRKEGSYLTCPGCKTLTMKKTGKKTLEKATYSSTGKGETELTCQNCGKKIYRPFVIPVKVRTSSGGFSGGSGRSGGGGGGSWGGGRTGGGGAGGRW